MSFVVSRRTHPTATPAPRDPLEAGAQWRLPDGACVRLRRVRPSDANALARLVRELSPCTRRARFPGSLGALTATQLSELTDVDFDHHVGCAVTIVDDRGEQLVGEARYMVDGSSGTADIALVLDDAWQRRGIGTRVLLAVITSATQRGLHWLRADVGRDNTAMLSLLQRCGFAASPHPDEVELMQLHLQLQALPSPD
ncbi:GNAT family N-acetyltransferase [Aquincola sp. S2]|uniref:GNAT family N-acetyltransferase n=1 Tax=Pseudaquabacterium terrae TaxID=2732868 RepID=A0ABX2ENL8_9BURK|nr:GNAT family N-acetyltransferase [Aquabacterium terrae]NRF70162.1 GNAT family N-acetyltransferase [Aquabacterium terrae]